MQEFSEGVVVFQSQFFSTSRKSRTYWNLLLASSQGLTNHLRVFRPPPEPWTMFFLGLSRVSCLLCLSVWSKHYNNPMTAIFNSGSFASMILKEWGDLLAIVALTWWLLMQSRNANYRKVRLPYAVRKQYILYTTIRHSIAVAYQAITLRLYYVHAALLSFLRRTCD